MIKKWFTMLEVKERYSGEEIESAMQQEINELRVALAEKTTSYMDGFEAGKDEGRADYAELRAEFDALKNQTPVAWLHTLRSNGLKEVDMYQTKNALWHSEPLGYLDCELVATKEKTE